tara:strand:+ start:795 stop:1355 length:561 start_codon:yes stop_codon:yes gene_type:complete
VRNFKNLKYSWETDLKVKFWKQISDDYGLGELPTRVKIDGGWAYPEYESKTKAPPDPRSDEQIENDNFINQVKIWDKQPEKKMVNEVKLVKKDIRDLGRRIYLAENGKAKNMFSLPYDDPNYCAYCFKQAEHSWGSRFSKGVFWHDLIDYVNQRFGLEIPKDILTDKEREKAIFIDKEGNLLTTKR